MKITAVALAVLLLAGIVLRTAHSRSHSHLIISGTPRIDIVVSGHHGFLFKPAHATKWVWYAPTIFGERDHIIFSRSFPGERQRWLIQHLVDQGIAVAGVDIGESYGSPTGRAIYQEFYRKLVSGYSLSAKPCLLAQSRGGLMLYLWASEHPKEVGCLAGIYPVTNLASWPPVDSRNFRDAAKAYGMSMSDFQTERGQFSPINHLSALAEQRIPVFELHGDADTLVPLAVNGEEFLRKYSELGGDDRLIVVHGKGHEEVNEFFESPDLLQFLTANPL